MACPSPVPPVANIDPNKNVFTATDSWWKKKEIIVVKLEGSCVGGKPNELQEHRGVARAQVRGAEDSSGRASWRRSCVS